MSASYKWILALIVVAALGLLFAESSPPGVDGVRELREANEVNQRLRAK